MTFNRSLFSSASADWATPQDLYKVLDQEFDFDFDPCPLNPQPLFDGLITCWGLRNFVNPPYNREISKWLNKALEERKIRGGGIGFSSSCENGHKMVSRYLPAFRIGDPFHKGPFKVRKCEELCSLSVYDCGLSEA